MSKYPFPFAVFALIQLKNGKYAATTRASDRGEFGRIGLPGGKVDKGESPLQALKRECREEGWEITGIEKTPLYFQYVDDKPVLWFRVKSAKMLKDYKEKARIKPIVVTKYDILTSGYGNENLPI